MRNLIMHCGKNDAPTYDPQVGAAAAGNAAISQKAEDFNENYYNTYVAPLLQQETAASQQTQDNQNDLYASNKSDMDQARAQYQKYGLPAVDNYYKMVNQYSSPDEENRQAGLALGDVRTAEAGQSATLGRSLASMGIDPTSPAALSAMTDATVQNTAAEAGAQNRARQAAKTLGMQLTGDAANFGQGGQSAVLGFGQAASGNTNAAYGTAANAVGTAAGGASNVNTGFGLGLQGYSANLGAYAGLQKQSMQTSAAGDAGLGNFLGSVATKLIPSDRRLKKNIMQVGNFGEFNLPLYTFDYLWDADGTKHTGVMAQDILPFIPEAVSLDAAGFYRVDYNQLR